MDKQDARHNNGVEQLACFSFAEELNMDINWREENEQADQG